MKIRKQDKLVKFSYAEIIKLKEDLLDIEK